MSVDESKQLTPAYETDYEIDDEVFYEPFVVLRNVNAWNMGWWNGNSGRKKVEALIKAFKTQAIIREACIQARISVAQYKYFCEIHPTFSTLKSRIMDALDGVVKQGYAIDLMKPENVAYRERFLLRRQPAIYDPYAGLARAPAGAVAKLTAEAFLDAEGNMIVSKQAAELIDEIENGDSQSKTE